MKGMEAYLSEHEEAQEKLYVIWRSGVLQGQDAYIRAWANSVERLGVEGECNYLCWLFRTHPLLSDPSVHQEAVP